MQRQDMAIVHQLVKPEPTEEDGSKPITVPAPQQDGSAVIIHIKNGDGSEYDPDTNTVQTEDANGDIVVSFGAPAAEQKDFELEIT